MKLQYQQIPFPLLTQRRKVFSTLPAVKKYVPEPLIFQRKKTLEEKLHVIKQQINTGKS